MGNGVDLTVSSAEIPDSSSEVECMGSDVAIGRLGPKNVEGLRWGECRSALRHVTVRRLGNSGEQAPQAVIDKPENVHAAAAECAGVSCITIESIEELFTWLFITQSPRIERRLCQIIPDILLWLINTHLEYEY
jgi:hypothetical protein